MNPFVTAMFRASAGALRVQDVFDIDLYNGSSAPQSIATPFAPDFVWIKSRSNGTDNALFDTTRGAAKLLISNSSAAQSTLADTLTAFTATGYTLGADTASFIVNTSSRSYVGWAFKEAPNFFDVVTYTGNATNRTLSHSLGVAPGMILVKDVSGVHNWQVYHRSLANTQYMVLNSPAAAASGATRWNSTTATSTSFSIGTANEVNETAHSYVAYLFAHDPTGVIQCGTFTTDGSGEATVVLGWEPQWVLIKLNQAGNDWILLDQSRGWEAGDDALLLADTSNAELVVADFGTPTGTGFTVASLAASQAAIYMAIRKGPM